jgi:hypothetical protein
MAPGAPSSNPPGSRSSEPDVHPLDRKAPHPRRTVRIAAVLVGLCAGVVFLAALGRDQLRCKDACYGPAPLSRYGSITYEPGHPWTRYAGSWQWSAQSALGHLALVAAIVALVLAATQRRNPVPAMLISVATMVAWATWVALSPATS